MEKELIYEIVVVADANDIDYVTAISTISEEDLKMCQPIFDALKLAPKNYNWESENWSVVNVVQKYPQIEPELIDEFDCRYVPSSEYGGVHTIVSIEYYPVLDKIKIL